MTPVRDALIARIRSAGRITFAEFMETALYHRDGGYYTRPGRISARGDFYTSPEVHPAFGALICVQLRDMWAFLGRPSTFRCVELGSASGTLAGDIREYAGLLDLEFAGALEYLAVDRAGTPPSVDRLEGLDAGNRTSGKPGSRKVGCVLSNELLDAFPVHRFVISEGRVYELYVCVDDDRLTDVRGEPSTPAMEARVAPFVDRLPDGFRGEVSLEIEPWAARASAEIDRGFVITIDFGYEREELYSPERRTGTLRCYYRHTVNADPFARVGEQDIAAHVDFTEVDSALATVGFDRIAHTSQAEFLRRLGAGAFLERLPAVAASPAEAARNRAAILELIKPEGLGRFRVALHGRGVAAFETSAARDSLRMPDDSSQVAWSSQTASASLPVPLLGQGRARVPVLEGRYPHVTQEFTGSWDDLLT